MAIGFNKKAGRYIDTENNVFVSRASVLDALNTDVQNLSTKLERLQGRLAAGDISLTDFSRLARAEMKPVITRGAALGAGGMDQLQGRQLGTLGAQAKQAYGSLNKLTKQLANGELTLGQAMDRTRKLSNHALQAFHRAEQISRAEAGFNLGNRALAPGFKHCPSCPAHETGGWVPIQDIIPIGSACECGGNCKCVIRYRREILSDNRGNLAAKVMESQARVTKDAPTV